MRYSADFGNKLFGKPSYVCNFCLYRYILISFKCGHRQLVHSLAWPIALTTNKLNMKDPNRWDLTEGTLQKDWHSQEGPVELPVFGHFIRNYLGKTHVSRIHMCPG